MNTRPVKTALITGADGALGTHVVESFLRSGCSVIGTRLPGTGRDAPSRANLRWIEVDLASSASVKKELQAISAEIDCLVHCAGGFRFAKVEETADEDLEFLLGANFRSAFYLARELLVGMKRRNFGRMVFVSARATLAPPAGMAAYAASKAALNALVSSLSDEVRGFDINVNAVMPTIIDTPANRRDMPKADFAAWVTPRELAEVIHQLAEPWGRPVHGALIPVAGRL